MKKLQTLAVAVAATIASQTQAVEFDFGKGQLLEINGEGYAYLFNNQRR